MPVVDSIAELNEMLAAADGKDEHRRIGNRAGRSATTGSWSGRRCGRCPASRSRAG
jgi:hypothetical protein